MTVDSYSVSFGISFLFGALAVFEFLLLSDRVCSPFAWSCSDGFSLEKGDGASPQNSGSGCPSHVPLTASATAVVDLFGLSYSGRR